MCVCVVWIWENASEIFRTWAQIYKHLHVKTIYLMEKYLCYSWFAWVDSEYTCNGNFMLMFFPKIYAQRSTIRYPCLFDWNSLFVRLIFSFQITFEYSNLRISRNSKIRKKQKRNLRQYSIWSSFSRLNIRFEVLILIYVWTSIADEIGYIQKD